MSEKNDAIGDPREKIKRAHEELNALAEKADKAIKEASDWLAEYGPREYVPGPVVEELSDGTGLRRCLAYTNIGGGKWGICFEERGAPHDVNGEPHQSIHKVYPPNCVPRGTRIVAARFIDELLAAVAKVATEKRNALAAVAGGKKENPNQAGIEREQAQFNAATVAKATAEEFFNELEQNVVKKCRDAAGERIFRAFGEQLGLDNDWDAGWEVHKAVYAKLFKNDGETEAFFGRVRESTRDCTHDTVAKAVVLAQSDPRWRPEWENDLYGVGDSVRDQVWEEIYDELHHPPMTAEEKAKADAEWSRNRAAHRRAQARLECGEKRRERHAAAKANDEAKPNGEPKSEK